MRRALCVVGAVILGSPMFYVLGRSLGALFGFWDDSMGWQLVGGIAVWPAMIGGLYGALSLLTEAFP